MTVERGTGTHMPMALTKVVRANMTTHSPNQTGCLSLLYTSLKSFLGCCAQHPLAAIMVQLFLMLARKNLYYSSLFHDLGLSITLSSVWLLKMLIVRYCRQKLHPRVTTKTNLFLLYFKLPTLTQLHKSNLSLLVQMFWGTESKQQHVYDNEGSERKIMNINRNKALKLETPHVNTIRLLSYCSI